VFELAIANRQSARGSTFWKKVEEEEWIPKRSADSMRNFWKSNADSGLEAYLHNAIVNKIWYCHAFPQIPHVRIGANSNVTAVENRLFDIANSKPQQNYRMEE